MTESPLLQVGLPAIGAPMMNTRRERAALAAMQLVGGCPTHRLPNGLGYIAPSTGAVHGPRRPTVAEVRDLYPLYAARGLYLTPLLRQAAR